MNKPFSIIKREFITNIYSVIRDSNLDLNVVDLIFKQIAQEISNIADKQAEEEYINWQRYLEEIAKTNEKPEEEKKSSEETISNLDIPINDEKIFNTTPIIALDDHQNLFKEE